MRTFMIRLAERAKQDGVKGGAPGLLRQLHVQDRRDVGWIAEHFRVSKHLVRMRLKALGIFRPRQGFAAKVKERGYADVADFFGKSSGKTFVDMARELGVSLGGVQYHYRKWLKRAGTK